jgi:hypothetical protein
VCQKFAILLNPATYILGSAYYPQLFYFRIYFARYFSISNLVTLLPSGKHAVMQLGTADPHQLQELSTYILIDQIKSYCLLRWISYLVFRPGNSLITCGPPLCTNQMLIHRRPYPCWHQLCVYSLRTILDATCKIAFLHKKKEPSEELRNRLVPIIHY